MDRTNPLNLFQRQVYRSVPGSLLEAFPISVVLLFGGLLGYAFIHLNGYSHGFNSVQVYHPAEIQPHFDDILPIEQHLGMDLKSLAGSSEPGMCSGWTQVNDGAFDLPTVDGSYNQEEGFEVAVFKDQLYVGQEADNTLGARLWRTKPGVTVPTNQSDWEEVAADASGNPFGNPDRGQNDHIDSLVVFHGDLYASTANHTAEGDYTGTLVYRNPDGSPDSWTQVNAAGFGKPQNENFKDMVVYPVGGVDYMCGGTWNATNGAEVWCTTDGTSWQQMNASGFRDPANYLIASINVYNGAIYVGVVNVNGGSLWRSDNLSTWSQVYHSADRPRVEVMEALGGDFYIAEGARDGRRADDPTIRILRSSNGDTGSWVEVGSEIHADPHNTRTVVDGSTVYNGALYVSVTNNTTGVELWRTDGSTWSQVGPDGLGNSTTFASQLLPFNGYLYAWTSDYTRGQGVSRVSCPVKQSQVISGPGSYDFPDVGAHLDFTATNLISVTISVYPGAFPTLQMDNLPVKRFYVITTDPVGGVFTARLTLSYTDAELAASEITDENTTYLVRWNGGNWENCPIADQGRDINEDLVTCQNVTAFSTWAIAGTNGQPTTVHLATLNSRSQGDTHTRLAWTVLLLTAISLLSIASFKVKEWLTQSKRSP